MSRSNGQRVVAELFQNSFGQLPLLDCEQRLLMLEKVEKK
jgi:hypothetical protein